MFSRPEPAPPADVLPTPVVDMMSTKDEVSVLTLGDPSR
jgi:hypothetical protein